MGVADTIFKNSKSAEFDCSPLKDTHDFEWALLDGGVLHNTLDEETKMVGTNICSLSLHPVETSMIVSQMERNFPPAK